MIFPRLLTRALAFGASLACVSAQNPQPLTLPAVLSGNHLDLVFVPDATAGVRLSKLVHKDPTWNATQHSFLNDPISYGFDGSLWEIETTDRQSGLQKKVRATTVPVANVSATSVDLSPGTRFSFKWSPVPMGLDTVSLTLDVTLMPDDVVSRWDCRVERITSGEAALDRVAYPLLMLAGPVEPVPPTESAFDAQWRTRIVIPRAIASSFQGQNMPLAGYSLLPSNGFELRHPHAEQVMQWSVMYAADPLSHAGGRMIYLGTEDTTGHEKRFRHAFPISGSLNPGYQWAAVHYPSFADSSGTYAEFGNRYESAYPTVVGALLATSDEFWFDAAEYYRGFVENSLGLVRRELNASLADDVGPAILSFPLQATQLLQGMPLYKRFLQITRGWRLALDNPHVQTQRTILHFQNYLKDAVNGGGLFSDWGAGHPFSATVDSGVAQTVAAARALGIDCSVRHLPVAVEIGSGWDAQLPESLRAYDRDRSVSQLLVGLDERLDYATYDDPVVGPQIESWFADTVLVPLVQHLDLEGLYLDLISGQGGALTYENAVLGAFHAGHGGDRYVRGLVAATDYTRQRLQSTVSGGNAFLMSEAVQEYMAGHLDFVGQGYVHLPRHMLHFEEVLPFIPVPPAGHEVPPEARDQSPPLWQAVYHEYQPAEMLTLFPSSRPLAAGLTSNELLDLYAWTFGTALINGSRPSSLVYKLEHDPAIVEFDESTLSLTDPTGVGLSAMAIVNALHGAVERSFAGQFTSVGRLERSLPDAGETRSTQINPTHRTQPVANLDETCFPVLESWDDPGSDTPEGLPEASMAFPVDSVLHSVWTSPEGKIGLVLYNWTSAPAVWTGKFDPVLYGIGANQSYNLAQLVQGGTPTDLGTVQGTITLPLTTTTIPSREVVVYQVTPL